MTVIRGSMVPHRSEKHRLPLCRDGMVNLVSVRKMGTAVFKVATWAATTSYLCAHCFTGSRLDGMTVAIDLLKSAPPKNYGALVVY